MTEIAELDPSDDAGLRRYFEVEQAATFADRPDAVLHTYAHLEQLARHPSPYHRRLMLVARDAGGIVGAAALGRPLQDNLHLAELEISVVPEARRRGVGRALHDEAVRRARADGRTTFLAEVAQFADAGPSSGYQFATALGFEEVHRNDHAVLDLPVPAELWASLPEPTANYEIVTWGDRTPEHLVEAYAAMLSQMGTDHPSGGVDHTPVVIDVARIREGETRTTQSHSNVVAAARRTSDGVLGGYTLVHLPHDRDHVVQDDTLVMPEHRGHGLGMALKAAVLRILASQHPERRRIHTWNAVENAPMQRINRALGFRPVELELEMQRREADD
jgi:GNAT superfamily N-acetyltransferase